MKTLLLSFLAIFFITNIQAQRPKTKEESNFSKINLPAPPPLKIGGKIWMRKNLDVSTYRNGDPIPKVAFAQLWGRIIDEGAYCYYQDDSATYAAIYGKLYNWWAVTDPRGLAPEGWHIPTDAEWRALIAELGGESVAGGKLKERSTTYWKSPNNNATNSSGFRALPGGKRNDRGLFDDKEINTNCYFWSFTDQFHVNAWSFSLDYLTGGILRLPSHKKTGMSVRCVKD